MGIAFPIVPLLQRKDKISNVIFPNHFQINSTRLLIIKNKAPGEWRSLKIGPQERYFFATLSGFKDTLEDSQLNLELAIWQTHGTGR